MIPIKASREKFWSESFNLENGVPWLLPPPTHRDESEAEEKGNHSTSNDILTVMNEAII